VLKDLIDEQVSYGNFSVSGVELSGSGEGYGVSEFNGTYPAVDFVLEVYYDEVLNESELNESLDLNVSEEIVIVNETGVGAGEETGEVTETPVEGVVVNDTEEVVNETLEEVPEVVENDTEIPVEEIPAEEPAVEIPAEEPTTSEVPTEESATPEVPAESIIEAPAESSPVVETPITGNIIKSLAYGITQAYLSISSITGKSVSGEQIEASVSYDEPYEYKLEKGQSARIVSSSENVNIEIKNKKVIITTDYIGDSESRDLIINLTSLGIKAELIRVSYNPYQYPVYPSE